MFLGESHRRPMSGQLEILQGTLDLMALETLAAGSLNRYRIARRIEQFNCGAILLNQGTIYARLVRLVQRCLIRSEWGARDHDRHTCHSIKQRGFRGLAEAAQNEGQLSTVIPRFSATPKEHQS
jgi:PadR family transcriptional regulator PadR